MTLNSVPIYGPPKLWAIAVLQISLYSIYYVHGGSRIVLYIRVCTVYIRSVTTEVRSLCFRAASPRLYCITCITVCTELRESKRESTKGIIQFSAVLPNSFLLYSTTINNGMKPYVYILT